MIRSKPSDEIDLKSARPRPFIGAPIYRREYAVSRKIPFYGMVPKDRRNNLIFRANLHLAAFENPDFQASQRMMCREDFLYWLNAYGRTHDPRVLERGNLIYGRLGSDLPFITRVYQDDAALDIIDCVESQKDCVIHKSRDLGATWLIVMVCFWFWLFQADKVFLFLSRKQDLVDRNKPQDKKSMFGKVDHAYRRLPIWMRPSNTTRTLLYFSNDDNGSEITGESTTGDSGRADRATAVVPDEFASVPDGDAIDAATARVTGCRIFNSTPKGSSNAFARKCAPGVDIVKITMLWWKHPEFRRGAYRFVDGRLLLLDPEYKYPKDYVFKNDGKLRSPWFDAEERRYGHPTLFAQEVEGDFFSSDFQFFDAKMLADLTRETCRPPVSVGRLEFDSDGTPGKFVPAHNGQLKIWVPFPQESRPDRTLSFVVGCDISHGTGATPSVASVGCIETRERVAEFVDANLDPRAFAVFVVALCKWFAGKDQEGAFLIWEGNGPGSAFGKRVWELGYRRFYYRKGGVKPSLDALGGHDRPSLIGGWWSNEDSRVDLLNQYAEALNHRKVLVRSQDSLEECQHFVYTDGGKIINSKEKNTIDPSGSRQSHSDRVIADALMWKAISELGKDENEGKPEVPEHSAAYRLRKLQEADDAKRLAYDEGWLKDFAA